MIVDTKFLSDDNDDDDDDDDDESFSDWFVTRLTYVAPIHIIQNVFKGQLSIYYKGFGLIKNKRFRMIIVNYF